MANKVVIQYRIVDAKNVELQKKIDAHRIECARKVTEAFRKGRVDKDAVDEYRTSYMIQAAFNDVVEADHGQLSSDPRQQGEGE